MQKNLKRAAQRALVLLTLTPLAHAAQTDIADVPLITSAPQAVLPNLMFVLDDSGSMDWTYMPDTVSNFDNDYGYVSSQCNGVYYNPAIRYLPPVDSTGASYANSSFTSAWQDGFNQGSGSQVDLSKNFSIGSFSSQAAFYYKYSGTNTADAKKTYYDTNSSFYKECNTSVGTSSAVFTKVVVSSTSGPGGTDETQNFANWYSYYRKRILMMKSAAGLAFKTIGDQFRVGYMSINNNVSPSFLNINKFDATQKQSWYAKLYGAKANNSTPLREALSNAGRIYAHKITSLNDATVNDPVQYSCQKNFTLLSTDGFWNGNGTYDLSGNAVGNQDGGQPRPFSDGLTSTTIYQSVITLSGSGNGTSVTSIKVGGVEILNGSTNSKKTANGVASAIESAIDACTANKTGNCGVSGYSATASGNTVTIIAPSATSATPVLVFNNTGVSGTATAFAAAASNSGGTSDTLADVAEYYYKTDLRSSALGNATGALNADVSANNVLPGGDDTATWQHMTTFTLGIGTRGRMIYTPTYKTNDTAGDYTAVLNGTLANPTNGVCSWQTSGTVCNWPVPGSDQIENVDDLWHAAVNGRGTYFSATDPASLAVGIQTALQAVNEITSDAAAATTSTPNITQTDNFEFASNFRSGEWYGELARYTLDVNTGNAGTTPDWSARPLLDSNTSRTIYTYDASAGTKLRAFTWANLSTTERAWFSVPYISSTGSPTLSQFCPSGVTCLSAAAQTAASGQPLVDFIRGDRTNEGAASDPSKYFRARTSVLGDIVHSEAVYIKAPRFNYTDTGYSSFKSANATRRSMVYAGANDGMLHAFDATTGQEAWAYIPQMLLPNLYRLADKYYPTHHVFYVDGTPTQGDVYFGGAWHTILVGGLNAGGRGYYALDVTDPNNPKALWEYTDTNMGLTFGTPQISKLKDGTWAVFVTSGYNNTTGGGDGQGRLYVLNAATGALIRSISTGQGTAAAPSGLAQIRTWVDNNAYDNTVQRVYGGDLLGNLWRFDVNGDIGAAGYDAQLLATLKDSAGNAQPITTKPELGLVAGRAVVFIGTGRYLGAADLSDTSQQSFYAIKDTLGTTSYGNPRASANHFVQQTLTDGVCGSGQTGCSQGEAIRTSSNNPVNFAVNDGWFIDLPMTSERSDTDSQLALGTLAFTTNVLNPSACTVGGSSWLNFVDYRTGGSVSQNGMVSVSLGQSLALRVELVKLPNRQVHALTRKTDSTIDNRQVNVNPSRTTRRVGWRELVKE